MTASTGGPMSATTRSWPAWSPRYATPRDPDRPTLGDTTAAHIARIRRAPPYAWQWAVADVLGELNDAGDGFRYPVAVIVVPRRAGKTTLALGANLDRLDIIPDARCWYTAHKREAAAKLFRDEWAPMVEPLSRLYRLRRSQGSEGIHKRRGSSRLQLFAPTPDALHSTNADTVTVDEAWAFDVAAGESIESGITPAQLTRPWRQTLIVSAGGTIESTWLDRWMIAGEAATPGVALFDYGADPTDPGYDPASPATWAAGHPTAGVAFPLDVLAHEWATRSSDAAFERAYLNVWPRPSTVIARAGLDLDRWRHAAHPTAAPTAAAIALDIAADRSAAAIAVAGPSSTGAGLAVEVLEHRPGVGWLAAAVRAVRAAHRGAPVVADSIVAASVVAELARAGVTVEPVGAGDHARACGTFIDLLDTARVSHRAQSVLDDAVAGAARRPLGDAWLWSRARSGVDICPLVAATLAVWAAHTRRPGGQGAVVTIPPPRHTGHPGYAPHRATQAPFRGPR